MMNLTEVKKELRKFDRYTFYEEPHIYTYKEDDGTETQVGISVTTLVSQYENPFNEDEVAERMSKIYGTDKQFFLDEWHYKRDFACCKGTHTHAYNEFLWKGEELYSYDKDAVIAEFGEDVIAPVWDRLKRICQKFYDRFKDKLVPIGLEQIVGSRDYDIAGAIDFLAYSKKLDAIIIIDYKTNNEIKTKSYQDKKMLAPLDNIPDCNYYHYSLQLALYKCIIMHETNLKIHPQKWLVWINENNDDFKLYQCTNMDDKAQMLLEMRKKDVCH